MEYVCPECNGFPTVQQPCPICGMIMMNRGTVLDFAGPYSPYENDTMLSSAHETTCQHFYTCPVCDETFTVSLKKDCI